MRLNTGRGPNAATLRDRVMAQVETLRRISFLPVDVARRAVYAVTKAIAAALYGCETQAMTIRATTALRHAIAQAVARVTPRQNPFHRVLASGGWQDGPGT